MLCVSRLVRRRMHPSTDQAKVSVTSIYFSLQLPAVSTLGSEAGQQRWFYQLFSCWFSALFTLQKSSGFGSTQANLQPQERSSRLTSRLTGSSVRLSLPWPRAEGEEGRSPLLAKPPSHQHCSLWNGDAARQRQWRTLTTVTSAPLWHICGLWSKFSPELHTGTEGRCRQGLHMLSVQPQELSFPTPGTIPDPLTVANGSLDANYPVVLSSVLQNISHLLHLWLLSTSEKDTLMATHIPSTSMVTFNTTVIVLPGSGGLRAPKPFPGSVAHRVLCHGPSQTLRWYFTDLISFCFTQSRK